MNIYNSFLRPVTNDDLQLIFNWRNRIEIRKFMFNNKEIEWEEHLNWFNSLKNDENNIIKIFIEDGEPRGVVQVNKINTIDKTAEWGFYIGDGYKIGLGKTLAYHALNYIYNELNIRKLSAKVLSTNEKSLRFHQKIGFVKEGTLRQHITRDKKFLDIILFAQFNQSWKHNKTRLLEDYTHGERYTDKRLPYR